MLCVLLIWILSSQLSFTQVVLNTPEKPAKREWIYPSINLLIAAPTAEFKDAIEKSTLWGFNIDAALKPFKDAEFIQPGAQIELLFPTSKKDKWYGTQTSTTGVLINTNLFLRFKFLEKSMFSPFIEGAYGLKISSTSTTFEIVDKKTFLEKFLLNEQDEVKTESLYEHHDSRRNFSLGAGCVINRIFSLQVKYNFGPDIEFIKKEDIVVNNYEVGYDPTSSPYRAIVIALGFSFQSVMNK